MIASLSHARPSALVIRRSSLGDVVLVEPVVRALRRAGFHTVDLVTDPHYAALCRATMGFDRVVADDARYEDRGLAGLKRVRRRLAEEGYDAVIDLQGKLRTRWLARTVPANDRVVLTKRTVRQGIGALMGHDPPMTDRRNVDMYLDVLRPLGVDVTFAEEDLGPHLKRPEASLYEAGPVRRLGLGPAASRATKRWRPERFAQVADGLFAADPSLRVVLIGGPEDEGVLRAVRAAITRAPVETVDSTTRDVLGLAHLVAGLDLMVTNDTGPAHLAAGFGVPTVVVFGPTSIVRWGPIGSGHRVVSLGLDCAPCSNLGADWCPRLDRKHACMSDLPVDPVLDAARRLWSSSKRR